MKITLLNKNQMEGNIFYLGLDVIDKMGNKCAVSDYAILLGCDFSNYSNVFYDDSIKGRCCRWSLINNNKEGGVLQIDGYSTISTSSYDRHSGIRPVIKDISPSLFSSLLKNSIKNNKGVLEVEYGEYPQYAVTAELNNTLETEYQCYSLRKTGKKYTFDSNQFHTSEFNPKTYDEYIYNGKKYIRVKSSYNRLLSNGIHSDLKKIIWIEVSPIKWYIDEKEKILISKNVIAAGIRFCDFEQYYGYFKGTEMYLFLNKYFKNEIIPSCIEKIEEKKDNISNNELNKKTIEIKKLVDTIYSLLKDYYGEEDIKAKVIKLINEYNENIDNTKEKSNLLTIDNMDRESLYLKLVNDLENILSVLKLSSEKYKEYTKMLELINNCLNILNGNINDLNNDLCIDISTIKKVIFPFINNKEREEELINILLEEKNNILNYLKGNEESPIKECKTIDDFILGIRSKLYLLLWNLNNDVRNNTIIYEIRQGYTDLCNGIFVKSKKDYINNILSLIQKSIRDINARGTQEEKEKLNYLLSNNILDDNDIQLLINKIIKLYIEIYKIYLDINERECELKEISSYKVVL